MTVEFFTWNPTRPVAPSPAGYRCVAPINNFGDLLEPLIVEHFVRRPGLVGKPQSRS